MCILANFLDFSTPPSPFHIPISSPTRPVACTYADCVVFLFGYAPTRDSPCGDWLIVHHLEFCRSWMVYSEDLPFFLDCSWRCCLYCCCCHLHVLFDPAMTLGSERHGTSVRFFTISFFCASILHTSSRTASCFLSPPSQTFLPSCATLVPRQLANVCISPPIVLLQAITNSAISDGSFCVVYIILYHFTVELFKNSP